jgi:hypothetical protein
MGRKNNGERPETMVQEFSGCTKGWIINITNYNTLKLKHKATISIFSVYLRRLR